MSNFTHFSQNREMSRLPRNVLLYHHSPRSHTANAKGVNQADQKLEEENEEENHEVHWTVISEKYKNNQANA